MSITVNAPTTQASPASPETAGQTGKAAKIRITIKKLKAYGDYEIKSHHDIPPIPMIRRYLPTKLDSVVGQWYYNGMSLAACIHNASGMIRLKDWTQAIARATAAMIDQRTDAEIDLLGVIGGGYLSLGDALFRLNLVDLIPTKVKALPALRARVVEEAKQESSALITAATEKADRIETESNRKKDRLSLEIFALAEKKAGIEREIAQIPPRWVIDSATPISYRLDRVLFFGFIVEFKITSFEFYLGDSTYIFKAVEAPAVPILLWAPLNEFRPENIQVDSALLGGYLPHTSIHSCVGIGDAPRHINSRLDVEKLAAGFARTMAVTNMCSLLSHYLNWTPLIHRFIPAPLKAVLDFMLKLPGWNEPIILQAYLQDDTTYPLPSGGPPKGELKPDQIIPFVVEEEAATFTVPATPEGQPEGQIETPEPEEEEEEQQDE